MIEKHKLRKEGLQLRFTFGFEMGRTDTVVKCFSMGFDLPEESKVMRLTSFGVFLL